MSPPLFRPAALLSCAGFQVKTQTAGAATPGRFVRENATAGLACGQGWRGNSPPPRVWTDGGRCLLPNTRGIHCRWSLKEKNL